MDPPLWFVAWIALYRHEKSVSEAVLGLRWSKSSEQHWQDKQRRGSLGYARDRLF
jgi:hypothetical protein